MKKIALIALVLAMVLALSACSTEVGSDVDVAKNPQDVFASPATPTAEPTPSQEDYAAAAQKEEGIDIVDSGEEPDYNQQGLVNADVNATVYPYSGATPVLINPVDMPSPTPPPEVNFEVVQYHAAKLGLTFNGPANWQVDDSGDETFILTDYVERDGFNATIALTREIVVDTPTLSELKQFVEAAMKSMGQAEFSSFKSYSVEERTLLGENGAYTNYRGTLPSGAIVRGRYHVVVVGKVRYIIHLRHGANFNEDYLKNYVEIRSSIQASN